MTTIIYQINRTYCNYNKHNGTDIATNNESTINYLLEMRQGQIDTRKKQENKLLICLLTIVTMREVETGAWELERG